MQIVYFIIFLYLLKSDLTVSNLETYHNSCHRLKINRSWINVLNDITVPSILKLDLHLVNQINNNLPSSFLLEPSTYLLNSILLNCIWGITLSIFSDGITTWHSPHSFLPLILQCFLYLTSYLTSEWRNNFTICPGSMNFGMIQPKTYETP